MKDESLGLYFLWFQHRWERLWRTRSVKTDHHQNHYNLVNTTEFSGKCISASFGTWYGDFMNSCATNWPAYQWCAEDGALSIWLISIVNEWSISLYQIVWFTWSVARLSVKPVRKCQGTGTDGATIKINFPLNPKTAWSQNLSSINLCLLFPPKTRRSFLLFSMVRSAKLTHTAHSLQSPI